MILLNIAEKAGWFAQNFLCNMRIDRQAAHHIIRLQEISGGVCHKVLCTLFIPAMRDTAERKWASGTLWERSTQRAELPCGALPFVYLTRDHREPPRQRGGFRIFRGARRRHGGLQHALHCFWRKAPRFVIARRPVRPPIRSCKPAAVLLQWAGKGGVCHAGCVRSARDPRAA